MQALRSNRLQMFFKTGVFKNFAIFTGKPLCWSLFLLKSLTWRFATLIKKETPTHVFFCEYCEIFQNNFFYRTPPVATSGTLQDFPFPSFLLLLLLMLPALQKFKGGLVPNWGLPPKVSKNSLSASLEEQKSVKLSENFSPSVACRF